MSALEIWVISMTIVGLGLSILWNVVRGHDFAQENSTHGESPLFKTPPKMTGTECRRACEYWRRQVSGVVGEPVPTLYYGSKPDEPYLTPERGALGVTADAIVFVGLSSGGFEVRIPFEDVRWISEDTATIYVERNGCWQVHMLHVRDWETMILSEYVASAIVPIAFKVVKPFSALQVRQSMLGQWTADRTVTLFLLPDRLLADWRDAVLFADIRQITLITHMERFRHSTLLRLECAEPGQPRRVIGFALPESQAQGWVRNLGYLTGLEVDVQSGRKKKATDDSGAAA